MMAPPSFCVPLRKGSGWFFEGFLCIGILFGCTVLTAPTRGLALNLGPITLLLYRVGEYPKRQL